MKKNIYKTGTGYNGVVREYIETPQEAMVENDIAMAKAQYEAETDPWAIGVNMLGNMAISYASSMKGGGNAGAIGGALQGANSVSNNLAMGGMVDGVSIEAEGKEVIQTPEGEIQQLEGPSHEGGGINMLVPPGTEIFSHRLKGADGKSMADRKKAREKKKKKYEKLYKKNPSDTTLKSTLDRIFASNQREEKEDMTQQELARSFYNLGTSLMEGDKMNYAAGGTVFGDFFKNFFGNGNPNENSVIDYSAIDNYFNSQSTSDNANLFTYDGVVDTGEVYGTTVYDKIDSGNSVGGKEKGIQGFLNNLFGGKGNGGITAGDGIGFVGDLVSTFGPMMNTKKNRAGDTPNINHFKDFGNDALNRLDDSKKHITGQRESALNDLETSRTGAIKRGRNSARGVNTMRALDLATDQSVNNTKSQIYNQFAQQMMNILGQQASFENEQDFRVMSGEQQRDDSDRRDRDAYYSQMAEDIATKGEGLRKIGKDVNAIKTRKTTGELLNEMYPDFDANIMNGSISGKATEPLIKQSSIYNKLGNKELKDKYYNGLTRNGWNWKDGKLYNKNGEELDTTTLKKKK